MHTKQELLSQYYGKSYARVAHMREGLLPHTVYAHFPIKCAASDIFFLNLGTGTAM